MAIRQLRHAPRSFKNGGQTKLLTAGRRTAYLSPHSRNLCPTFSNRFSGIEKPKAFHYNQTEYQLADTKSQAMGYSLLHVNDSVDGCEMWIMDNPDFPLIWEIQNNPLGINWKVAPIALPAHNLKEEIIQSPEKWAASIMLIPHQTAYKLRYPKVTVLSTSAITDAMGPAG